MKESIVLIEHVTEDLHKSVEEIEHVEKFNPWHDRLGRFTSGNGFMSPTAGYGGDKNKQAVTFSANPKTRAGAMAIARHSNGQDGHEVISEAFGGKPTVPEKTPKPKKTPEKAPEKTPDNSSEERNFKTITRKDFDEMFNEMHSDMTAQDKKDLVGNGAGKGYFQTWHSFHVNRALREGTVDSSSPEIKKAVADMDRNMKPITKDIKVSRMIQGDEFLRNLTGWDLNKGTLGDVNFLMKNDAVGGTVTEKGFMSTSFDMKQNVFGNRNTKINLNVPKGAKAIMSPTGEEAEICLNRGTKYKIKDIRITEDAWGIRQCEIDADVIVD